MSLMPDLSSSASTPDNVIVRRMVALFDYDPWENSPNMDSEVSTIKQTKNKMNHTSFLSLSFLLYKGKMSVLQAELGFRSGDIIYVLGDMDQDGFYYVSPIPSPTTTRLIND